MAQYRWIRVLLFSAFVLFFIFSGASCNDDQYYPSPKLELTKEASPSTFSAVGEQITYTYYVSNSGGSGYDLSITDSPLDGPVICEETYLDSNDSTTCTGTHTITQEDLDNGSVQNHASASVSYLYATKSTGCCGCGGTKNEYMTTAASADAVVTYQPPEEEVVEETVAEQPQESQEQETQPEPVLLGTVTYCDKDTKSMNFRLREDADSALVAQRLASGELVIKIGGAPATCLIPQSNLTIVSCAPDPGVTLAFPTIVEEWAGETQINQFEYDGFGCNESIEKENDDDPQPLPPPVPQD